MVSSLAFIFNHVSDGNSPCIGQLLNNAMTVYTQIGKKKPKDKGVMDKFENKST